MKKPSQEYYQMRKIWEKIPFYVQNKSNGILMDEIIDKEKYSLIGFPYFFVLYDHSIPEMKFVSNEIENMLGFVPKDVIEGGEHLIFDQIWDPMKPFVAKKVEQLWENFGSSRKSDILNYRLNMCYMMKMKDDAYHKILHQYEVISLTKEKFPELVISRFVDLQSLNLDASEITFHVINKKNNEVIEEISEYVDNKSDNLTSREKQINHLVSQGLSSLEISKILSISKNTVDTHRRNIRLKNNGI